MLYLLNAEQSGAAAQMRGYAEQCMSEYNLDGWTSPDLVRSDDISVIMKGLAAKA